LNTLLFLLLLVNPNSAESEIREQFHQQRLSEQMLRAIESNPKWSINHIASAYQGICETMLADHVFWPGQKMNYFLEGKAKIEQAILVDNDNPELRYLRLLIQLNAPSILNYDDKVEEDLDFFVEHISGANPGFEWIPIFCNTIIKSRYIDEQQQRRIQNFLLTFKATFD
jgi:hypothetical protein